MCAVCTVCKMPALNFGRRALQKAKYNLAKRAKSIAINGKHKVGHTNSRTLELQLLQSDFVSVLDGEFRKRGMRRAINKDFRHDDGSFYKAIAPVLVMAQCFCLMPVYGIYGKSTQALRFRWRSGRTLYCFVYVITTFITTVLAIHILVNDKVNAHNLKPLIFDGFLFVTLLYFLYLAGKWPRLMQHWAQVEHYLPSFGCVEQRDRLPKRIKFVSLIFLTLGLTEHLLSTISSIHYSNNCPFSSDPIESFFKSANTELFSIFEYNIWLALIAKLQNVYMTFGWSYTDVFLMNIGIGLSELFNRLQQRMERVQGKHMPECYWSHTRQHYRMICDLIADLDKFLSGIVMLSFANNLYFVCIQCLQSLNKMPSIVHAIYFYFSLFYLLCRTLAVSLLLAEVNDRAVQPLQVLKHIPSNSYNKEIERLWNEVANDVVALTGMKFFTITRKLMLTLAGTIVTYELVLIQFHEDQNLWRCGTD